MTECSELGFELPGFSGRKIEGNFEGGNVSSGDHERFFASYWLLNRLTIRRVRGAMLSSIFISHSSKDKATADAICQRLEADGIKCWIAPPRYRLWIQLD
jgi:TIR domain-containing protein